PTWRPRWPRPRGFRGGAARPARRARKACSERSVASGPMTQAKDYSERRWLGLVLLCVSQFVVVLDASIVNVALPSIGDALDFSQENLSWVVNAYVLTFGGFLLLGGRLADL